LSRPFPPRAPAGPSVRVNGKIRAREVRVIGVDGKQLGILSLSDAINRARAAGVDLVEIAPNAEPPVCRLVDYGKFRYEQAKKDKESRKHQHANRVKEVQLSPSIDPHDFKVKLEHATGFLCEEMKVKVTLRFRGREMMHKEYGFQQVTKFIEAVMPYAHPDSEPKLVGRGITVMLSPLPRNKRAKNPYQVEGEAPSASSVAQKPAGGHTPLPAMDPRPAPASQSAAMASAEEGFVNNPFAQIDLSEGQSAAG
jgi:translation initiation factor IF-3